MPKKKELPLECFKEHFKVPKSQDCYDVSYVSKKKQMTDPYANFSNPETFVDKTQQASNDYDARTGRFVSVGDFYGIGHKEPVGSFSQKKESPIPYEKR
jgi:hypothetical protein